MSFTLGLMCPHDDDGNCTCRNYQGKLSLYTSSEYGYLEQVQQFLEKKPEKVNVSDSFGYTALHYAAQRNKVEVVRYLLKKGAQVDIQDCGATPLHRAAAFNAVESCQILVEAGANVNAIDLSFGDGRTPLMKAAALGFDRIVRILIDSGKVDEMIADSSGMTAWELSKEYPEVRQLIKPLNDKLTVELSPSEFSKHDAKKDEANLIPANLLEISSHQILSCELCGNPSLFMSRFKDGLICRSCFKSNKI